MLIVCSHRNTENVHSKLFCLEGRLLLGQKSPEVCCVNHKVDCPPVTRAETGQTAVHQDNALT